jgi:hypothetical protein
MVKNCVNDSILSSEFCTRENWQTAVLFLAQEMEQLGLASPCTKVENYGFFKDEGWSSKEDENDNDDYDDIKVLVTIHRWAIVTYSKCLSLNGYR